MKLSPVDMRFSYQESFHSPTPEAYETLLLDIILGDATLFVRADREEAAWRLVTPILEAWEEEKPDTFPNYRAGGWGPVAADRLLEVDEKAWILPDLPAAGEKS